MSKKSLSRSRKKSLPDQMKLNKTLDLISDGVIICDTRWRCNYANKAAAKILQLSMNDIENKTFWSIVPRAPKKELEEKLSSRKKTNCEIFLPSHKKWLEIFLKSEKLSIIITLRDIMEQKKTSIEYNRLHSIIQSNTDSIWSLSLDGKLSSWNKGAKQLYGYTSKEALGKPIELIVPENQLDKFYANVKRILQGKSVEHYESQRLTKSGKIIDVSTSLSPIQDINGQIIGISVIGRNITQQKQIEKTLQYNEQRYRTLIEKSFDALVLLTKEGTRLYATPSISRVLGYKSGEDIGKNALKKVHPEDQPRMKTLLTKVSKTLRKSTTAEWRVQDRNGNYRWLEGTFSNFLDDPVIGAIIVNYHDITDRKLSEEKIAKSEERFRTLIQQSADAIQLLDPKHHILYSSDSIRRVLGYTPAEIKGENRVSFLHPDDQSLFDDAFSSILEKAGKHVALQYRMKYKNGGWMWVEAIYVNHLNNPAINAVVVNFRDITKRKLLEKQKDEFLSVASHELKTPVTSLKAFTQILQHKFEQSGNKQDALLLGKMDAQIDKLTALIQDLLDVSKIEGGRLRLQNEVFDFDTLVQETIEEVGRISERHKIIIQGKTNKQIYADRERIGQVITNFLTNAIKYSRDAQDIIVHISDNKREVTLSVEDFGVGIPKKDLPFVFDRFFRVSSKTHNNVAGLGIGLNIASEIIKHQGGKIWANSEFGKGSQFYFSLPLKQKK